jgi:hypothetical protein
VVHSRGSGVVWNGFDGYGTGHDIKWYAKEKEEMYEKLEYTMGGSEVAFILLFLVQLLHVHKGSV